MVYKVSSMVICACFAIVRSEPPSNEYGTPLGAPISSYGTPNYHANEDNHGYGEPKAYEFGYQVRDDYTGNNYNRKEQSDGNQVRGEYRVQLPDGRTQIVTYWADWQSGFHADVKYEGTAQYPEQYNTNQGYPSGPSAQYGAPVINNYNNGYGGGDATSSVSIKDFSGVGNGYQNNNYYDSYNNGGDFSSKARPSNEYGAP